MKTLKTICLLVLLSVVGSCEKYDEFLQEREAKELNELLSEIKSKASSVICLDATEWKVTSYGRKACGGPQGHLAYSINIDVGLFLDKVKEHKDLENEFNKKWGVWSDCSIENPPANVICEEGIPVFEY